MEITYQIKVIVDSIDDLPDGAIIRYIDGEYVLAMCEDCQHPIFDCTTGYYLDYKGKAVCASCMKKKSS